MINRELEQFEQPHINEQILPVQPIGTTGFGGAPLSRKEKRAMKKEQRSANKALK